MTAAKPSHIPTLPPTTVASTAPIIAIPEIAFDPDIRGVCSVGGTFVIISKPTNRTDAINILQSLNGKSHFLISSVCISLDGKMIWNYTEKAEMKMKNFSQKELENYLSNISDKNLYSYNVYQIEGEGKKLFSEIKGNVDTIMGLPVKSIKKYLDNIK